MVTGWRLVVLCGGQMFFRCISRACGWFFKTVCEVRIGLVYSVLTDWRLLVVCGGQRFFDVVRQVVVCSIRTRRSNWFSV